MSKRAFLSAILAGAVAFGVAPAQAKVWRIGFVPKLIGIPYFNAMTTGLEKGGAACCRRRPSATHGFAPETGAQRRSAIGCRLSFTSTLLNAF